MVYLFYDIQLTPGGYCVNKQPKARRSRNGYWFFNWVLQSSGSFLHQAVKHRALWIVAATSSTKIGVKWRLLFFAALKSH